MPALAGRHGARVVGVDLSSAVEKAAALCADLPDVAIVQADLLDLPLAEGAFDLAFSIGVLHHSPDPRRAFAEVARRVKPGGRLAVWLYRRNTPPQEWLNSALRAVTTRLPARVLEPLCVGLGVLGGVPVLNRTLNKVANFSNHPDWTLRVCDNFDWYAPRYQSHHTVEELKRWFAEEGFVDLGELRPARDGPALRLGLSPRPGHRQRRQRRRPEGAVTAAGHADDPPDSPTPLRPGRSAWRPSRGSRPGRSRPSWASRSAGRPRRATSSSSPISSSATPPAWPTPSGPRSSGTPPTATSTGGSRSARRRARPGSARPSPTYRRVELIEGRAAPGLSCDARRPRAGRAVRLSRGPGPSAPVRGRGPRRVPAGTPHRVAIVGDIAAGTSAASKIAWRIGQERPDLLVVTGDIVYSRGRISEYADAVLPRLQRRRRLARTGGARSSGSTLSVAAPGNHDIADPRPRQRPRRASPISSPGRSP